jgi:transposase
MSSSVSSPPPRLINDELWALVEPLIPPRRRPSTGGPGGHAPLIETCSRVAFVFSTGRLVCGGCFRMGR